MAGTSSASGADQTRWSGAQGDERPAQKVQGRDRPVLAHPFAIAWQAHLGGYIAGLVLAGPFDRLRPIRA